MTTEIKRALNFTSRYVLALDLEFKDQGHFNVKLIFLNTNLILTTEIEKALTFTTRYVLDLELEVKDQGHFNVKLIFLMDTMQPFICFLENEKMLSNKTINI